MTTALTVAETGGDDQMLIILVGFIAGWIIGQARPGR